jgi:hypothetical protein
MPAENPIDESQMAYPCWRVVRACFFANTVSFASIVPYAFGLFIKPVAESFGRNLEATSAGFSLVSEGDIAPYLSGRYFGLKRFSTLYALTWTTYAIGAATGPFLVGRVFDTIGFCRPISIQLLALPAAIPCLLMFALPRYKTPSTGAKSILPEPQSVETAP